MTEKTKLLIQKKKKIPHLKQWIYLLRMDLFPFQESLVRSIVSRSRSQHTKIEKMKGIWIVFLHLLKRNCWNFFISCLSNSNVIVDTTSKKIYTEPPHSHLLLCLHFVRFVRVMWTEIKKNQKGRIKESWPKYNQDIRTFSSSFILALDSMEENDSPCCTFL